MEKEDKKKGKGDGERKEQKGEKLVEKLSSRRRNALLVGPSKVGPPSTPAHVSTNPFKPHNPPVQSSSSSAPPPVSSRKLAAALWEFHQYQCYFYPLPFAKMHRAAHGTTAGPSRNRRSNSQLRNGGGVRVKGLDLSHFLPDPSPSSPDHQPESATSLRRHIAQTLMQHHRAIERSNHALQPVSPASYGSSLEVAPYNPAATPSSSLEFRGRAGEYNLKTSTELLKVLNRIWSLEEQHASNISLIKALKTELTHARVRIRELLRDQQADRHELDDMMKQIAEKDKLARKNKEHERINLAMQSLREELDDERKLRKRSEGLHRKLARELSEVKSTLSNALQELEQERKSRKVLENLCDEFAKGIKSYEQEVHALKQKSDKDWTGKADQDKFILHIAESWLDERMQMKLEEYTSGFAKDSVLDKMGFEIETFLQAKRPAASKYRRSSLESVPLNDAISAPRDVGDEEDSGGSDSNCFELKKPSNNGLELKKAANNGDLKPGGEEAVDTAHHMDETLKSNYPNKEVSSVEKSKGQSRSPSNLQVKFEEQMAWAMSSNGKNKSRAVDTEEAKPAEITISRRSENCEITEEGSHEKSKPDDTTQGTTNSNNVMDNMIRNHIMLSEGGKKHHHEIDHGEASCSYPSRSPVRQWMSKIVTADLDISESSTKPNQGPKENTLKAKLSEARSKSSRPRLRLFKGSS